MPYLARSAAVLCLGIGLLPTPARAAPTAAEVFDALGFSERDRERAIQGEMVTTRRTESSERELIVVMAFLVNTPRKELVDDFHWARDYAVDPDVTAFKAIPENATVDAFRGLALQPGGERVAKLYLDPNPKELNLSAEEAAAFRALDRASPTAAVEAQLRKLLLARTQSYRRAGLDGIPPYDRGGKTYQPADDLRDALRSQALFSKYAPEFERTLREYPKYKAPGLREQLLWVNFKLDDLPTFVLNHQFSLDIGGATAVAQRHFYVSRSHNMVHIFGGLFPVEEGTLAFYENRTSTNRIAGFGAGTKQALGRKIMARQIRAVFEKYRATKVAP